MLPKNKYRFLTMPALIGIMFALLVGLPSHIVHAANCGGLPVSGGVIPPGNYTMTDNCNITATLVIDSGTVTINGGGFTISGGNSFRVLLVASGATLNLDNVTVADGFADHGGGLKNGGTVTITNSTLTNNSADPAGGGIGNGGTMNITNSTLSDNWANIGGGAIANVAILTITNSTLSSNSAFEGSAILNDGGSAHTTITHSTLVKNGGMGGSIWNGYAGNISIRNSIVTGAGCYNHFAYFSAHNNLAGSPCGSVSVIGLDPELKDNGGPTMTHALLPDSNAIDAATDCSPPDTDQRGISRPQGAGCDIGAYEAQVMPTGIIIALPPAPAPPTCNMIDSDITAYDLPDGFYCRVLMRDGAWQSNPGTIPQELIDNGVILAVDVFQLSGQQSDNDLGGHVPICLEGSGRLIFLDATTSPRVMVELKTFAADGMTCGWVPNAGTLVLIRGE